MESFGPVFGADLAGIKVASASSWLRDFSVIRLFTDPGRNPRFLVQPDKVRLGDYKEDLHRGAKRKRKRKRP